MASISRRRFFIHSAHKTIGVSAGLAAWDYVPWTMQAAMAEPAARTLNVCLVSGSFEYKSDQSLALWQEHLESRYAVKCHRAFAPSEESLPGLENLDQCDCAVFFTRRLKISGEPLERIKRYCTSGKPIIGIRTASHGFQNWLAMDKEVFGGDYSNHYGNNLQPRIELAEAAKDHLILKGVNPYVSSGSLYKNPHLASDVTVLLTGTIPEHTDPVAWVRTYHGSRVFYTSLGHADDFRHPSFLQLLDNALTWTTGRALG
jgi:type 1 glutamine amidotransferase